MVIYTGIIRIIMVGILFIFLCLFKKTRTFIKIVFNTNNKATELWDKGTINNFEVGTYRGLKQIHKYLYRDIYEFAGKTRDVNLSKEILDLLIFCILRVIWRLLRGCLRGLLMRLLRSMWR